MEQDKPRIAIVNSEKLNKEVLSNLKALTEFAQVERLKINKLQLESIIEALSPYEGIIITDELNYQEDILKHLPKLKIIAAYSTQVENVDIEVAQTLGIAVTKAKDPIARNAVAEHTIGLMISASRWIPQGDRAVRSQRWSERNQYIGRELTGATVGIVGFGNIGSRVAEILKKGFHSRVLVFDPKLDFFTVEQQGYHYCSFQDLIQESDFVTLHCPYNSKNHHLLSEKEFATMKTGVIIVNTSHGALVEERVLSDYLSDGHIKAYAADCLEAQPPQQNHHLFKHDNVIVTPQLGGYSSKSSFTAGNQIVQSMRAVFIEERIPTENLMQGMLLKEIRR